MARQAAGKPPLSGSIRIIAGFLRSRRLRFPVRPGLRPTGDRVRETLFNWLREDIVGARCLDLYAGSGALAVEALSRGAAFTDLVDNDEQVLTSLRQALQELALGNAEVHLSSAEQFITRQSGRAKPYDIIFLDPPFAAGHLQRICAQLASSDLLASGCRIYLESEQPVDEGLLPDSWQQHRSKKSGQVYYYLYEAPHVTCLDSDLHR
ncbi:MAG: 16S rRNA (guanine(966)-N(2))-methyltransferase RsmD [Pseudohongiellaceae bacterium]